ncbi:MAG: bifunctional phosphoribosylaminoimidazolecarboxamide formyltransferase/IMP cyclohydrolase [Candidatus Thermoplasmatota archaeon]|nr:bifunctional phosphoribosylaminoimidazolecarboxamide formyltransferase/IMP cyclohydrolase [Candidatus Thermoplasmatota archaeon]
MQRKALLSVSDKTGIVELAEGLIDNGFEIISSGGTASVIRENGLEVTEVSDVTGFPEILDGRVKTLHPKIHGGLLFQLNKHQEDIEEYALPKIDLLAVNLYPFEETTAENHDLEDAVENIDIGGVALLRAGAKNHERVTVVCDPDKYDRVLNELNEDDEIGERTKKELAVEAFSHTANYDTAIYNYFQKEYKDEKLPEKYFVSGKKIKELRYGENPNQDAAFYRTENTKESSVLKAEKLHGKALSYNNIRDLEASLDIVKEFEEPAVTAIKHSNPTGVATKENIAEAYQKAYECDPKSIYGSIVAANRPITKEMAEKMDEIFVEASIAPGYEEGAVDVLKNSKNIRIMELPDWHPEREGLAYTKVSEGLLVQDRNKYRVERRDMEVKSEREPTEEELDAMEFAWKVIKHVKSNAIIFTKKDHTVGIGAGQMSRVDAVKIAKMKAKLETEGATMASDAFFPFRDGIDEAAEAGIESVVQPGGSIRDDEVIEAVNEHDMSMVFTGQRVFKH